MPRYCVSERQTVLVTARFEADSPEHAREIFLDGDPPNIETEVLDSFDLSIEEEDCGGDDPSASTCAEGLPGVTNPKEILMSSKRDVEIEAAFFTGQDEYRKGTVYPALPLPEDEELAAMMQAGWDRLHEADSDHRVFGSRSA